MTRHCGEKKKTGFGMFFLTGVATVQMCQTMISYCYELQVKELFLFVLQLTTQEVTIISVYI